MTRFTYGTCHGIYNLFFYTNESEITAINYNELYTSANGRTYNIHENSRTILPCFQNLTMRFNAKWQTLSVITPTTQNSNIEKSKKTIRIFNKKWNKNKKTETISKSQINTKNIWTGQR